jgi:maltose O-acetyltransferase
MNFLKKIYYSILRKRQRINKLSKIESPVYVAPHAKFSFHDRIEIERFTRIGDYCHIDGEGGVRIEEGTILAPRVVILTSSHNWDNSGLLPYNIEDKKEKVKIGKGVWIGWEALILPGVELGDGCVVGARSVVTKSFSKGSIIAGNPARLISKRKNIENIDSMTKNQNYFLKYKIEAKAYREGRDKPNNYFWV